MKRRDWGAVTGVLVLLVTGAGLVALSPVEPSARPQEPVPVTECELVQLAVYELDTEPAAEFEQERYGNLTDSQQRVFDEARAANGDFVRFDDEDRMVAADALPYAVVFEGRTYRAHGVRGNCFDTPWYAGWVGPAGRVLLGLGIVVGAVFGWRRLTY
jgi:hypothetical protein